jgi:hypothetical protein
MLMAAQWACVDRTSTSSPTHVIDSAGIAVVINDSTTGSIAHWRTERALTIGQLDGSEEYTFGAIADVDVDSHGRLFVLDRQAQSAIVYDVDGRFQFRFGGAGEGPGEFSSQVMNIRVGHGDSVMILDFWQMRLNVYAPGGAPVRTLPLHFGRQGPYEFHWLPDGNVLVRWFTHNLDSELRFVPWDALLLSQEHQSSFDTLLTFQYRPPDLGGVEELLRPLLTNAAFYDVLADGRIVWSALEEDQLAVHGPDGSLHRMIRNRHWNRRALTAADREALFAVYRARANQPDGALPDNVTFPDHVPTITAVRASPDGGFWVQRMGPISEIDPGALFIPAHAGWLGGTTWEVYDRDRYWHAVVVLPRRFRVTRILDSTVIGVHRDDLDVEQVVVLRMLR